MLYAFEKLSHKLSPTVLDPRTKIIVLEMKQLSPLLSHLNILISPPNFVKFNHKFFFSVDIKLTLLTYEESS